MNAIACTILFAGGGAGACRLFLGLDISSGWTQEQLDRQWALDLIATNQVIPYAFPTLIG